MLPGEIDSDTISARERSILQGLGREPKRVGRLALRYGSRLALRYGRRRLFRSCGVLALALLALPYLAPTALQELRGEGFLNPIGAAQRRIRNLHACWDFERCDRARGNFSVYVHGKRSGRYRAHAIWQPPPGVREVSDPDEACVVVVPVELKGDQTIDRLRYLPGWNGGRNHFVINLHYFGISWLQRRRYLGCAMIGQTHMELGNYVHNFDVSVPRGQYKPRIIARTLDAWLFNMSTLARSDAPRGRRYWLTFKGTTYYDGEEGSQRTSLLPLAARDTRARPVVIALQCHVLTGQFKDRRAEDSKAFDARFRALCARLERSYPHAPEYDALLNTTFAIVASGRQPATYRLDEVMAAGAIPVLITGDRVTGLPYILPFQEVVPWHEISFHFPWREVPRLADFLASVSDDEIARMQAGVRAAWTQYLEPAAARRTLYTLLEQRSGFRYR